MVFGIDLQTFTLIHVIISLLAIASGFVAIFGMIAGRRMSGWVGFFLLTTIATSVTGFGFPFTKVTPGIIVGVISLLLLTIAVVALYLRHLAGPWRWIYIVTAVAALWFNVFVLIVQSFQKIAFLSALAPTQSEPPFQIAQGVALVLLIALGVAAVRKFHPQDA